MSAQSPRQTYLVDASVYIFRYYFALPPNWQSRSGYSTETVYGFTNFLLDLLARRPGRIACAFDESLGNCFRNEIYADYKCSRALPDEALAFQLAACREMSEVLGISGFASERYEADDILATLTRVCAETPGEAAPIVVTRDKDLGQLLDAGAASLWDFAANAYLDRTAIEAKFGVRPQQIADYLALVGDSIDDIPGVPGFGAKTAARLLGAFDTVEELIAAADQVPALGLRGGKGIAQKLADYAEQIRMSLKLARLCDSVPLNVTAGDLGWQPVDVDVAVALAEEFGLGRLGAKIRRTLEGLAAPVKDSETMEQA
ncbi:5'-3' exonuclease H3TH domain-containing protein [uncultured Microbulbifer sp.]|uniref:5'-3' exonuclease n=1 Tax=uncultured Microbulbifer sp. TaxID=348147 RepID=UPI0025E96A56|nr:5'-3' exonuclease H3TH domain-containing protein [uncultured Microbulbifer sp.]